MSPEGWPQTTRDNNKAERQLIHSSGCLQC